jgi:hypothetical protein
MERETCQNCGREIGGLETPYVYREHVVCAACHGVLVSAEDGARATSEDNAHPEGGEADPFHAEGVWITNTGVTDGRRNIPLHEILSVETAANLFGGTVVDIFDLMNHRHRFKFRQSENARSFLSVLVQLKGSLNINR